jgi:NTP pyrophosphatase (non-canonical NTP hydrolase)
VKPNDYQQLALVTEFTPDFVRLIDRQTGEPMSAEHNMKIARLLHAILGIISEAGELADALKKHIIYGKQLDDINVMEETGDLSWYEVIALHACKFTFEEAMERNIAKLKARFGDKFTEAAALTRNLDRERKTLEGGS